MRPTTTRARLAQYRKAAEGSKWSNDWRKHRTYILSSTVWRGWSEDRRKVYADARDTLGDYLGDWTQFAGGRDMRDTLGFYADSYCHDTIKGGVERIRTAKGCLYVPVTYCTGWDGVTYYMADAERVERGAGELDHERAIKDAAACAMYRAEREADESREANAKDQAAHDIDLARADIHQINKDVRALLAEIRGREFTENVCAALRHRLREYLADRKRLFARIAERTDNYWSAVEC